MVKINISSNEIIQKYADMVYRIALARVKRVEDAEDVFQDVFVSLIKNIDKIDSELHLKHWLIRTTINRSTTMLANFWRKKVELLEEYEETEIQQEENLEIEQVRELVKTLPEKLKNVVLLYYYEEYSVTEIACILKIKQGTVKSRLHTARQYIKGNLDEKL